MENKIAKPQLGFMEAVKLALGRLTDFKGRSRRSEFWWFMLAFIVASYVVSLILQLVLPLLAAEIIGLLLWSLALAVTMRRLHDTGHSHWWVVVSWVANAAYALYLIGSGAMDTLTSVNANPTAVLDIFKDPLLLVPMLIYYVAALGTFIFCLLDSKPEANQYGPSPKYEPAP